MLDLFTESAPLFIGMVFAFALIIGSFLNVVIHRLPIMMEREWREHTARDGASRGPVRPGRAAVPLPVLRS